MTDYTTEWDQKDTTRMVNNQEATTAFIDLLLFYVFFDLTSWSLTKGNVSPPTVTCSCISTSSSVCLLAFLLLIESQLKVKIQKLGNKFIQSLELRVHLKTCQFQHQHNICPTNEHFQYWLESRILKCVVFPHPSCKNQPNSNIYKEKPAK